MKRKNILKFVSLLGIGSFVMLAAASCTKPVNPTPNPTPTPEPKPNPTPNPNPPSGGMNGGNTNPGNGGGMDNSAQQLSAAKTEAKAVIDASAELSDSVKEALKRQVDATTTGPAARDLKTKTEALVSAVKALSGSVTAAKTLQAEEQYTNVSQDFKTALDAKLTAATALLEDGTKLKNLDASSNLDTTKASLESAKTALDAAVAAVKPDLDFQKTKTSAASAVEALNNLVNSDLKAELQRQVTALDKDHAAQATTMLKNLTSLKDSLTSLQDLVSKGLAMQVNYPRSYYDADNKADFDAALLKASLVFPAFQWTAESIMVPAATNGALPNPRAWTAPRAKTEFVLQNFVMAPAQAATPTTTQTSPSATASATVRVAMSGDAEGAQEEDSESASPETQPAAPTADLASTASYLKTLDTDLKVQTAALNGDNPREKMAYYKPVVGRTLYWDGFMPKITLESFTESQTNEDDNKTKLQTWFDTKENWSNLEDQLVKKLGSEKFKNVKLTNPQVDWDIVNNNEYRPKVTFNVTQKEGYELQSGSEFSQILTMVIRVLYTTESPNANVLQMQGASSSASPNRAREANHPHTIKDVNVYLNYTGPAIVLNADLPKVGKVENTTTNGTSSVTGAFNDKFKDLIISDKKTASLFFQAIQKYVNTFDPKYPAKLISEEKNGITLTRVVDTALRIANFNDSNAVFLQQIKDDTEAVYFAVMGVASNKWLNTFLIRIPLTKFVKPLTTFTSTPASAPAQTGSGTGSTQQAQSSPTTGTSSSSN
ncbi:GA module-containing protein [Mycoplasmoides gallisepticum]|uniref:GA module-containing protein n=1 Tax=Mycoplasmoides gallisepticum TaxID=2096 RepID=UPI001245E163|nr:GA module-containing protein [Mycoplasmoides gallisepticum]QEX46131.1 hypothetical protein F6J65_03335 [Mycoplasmoides gallisepticum]